MTDTSTAMLSLTNADAIRRAYRARIAIPSFNVPYLPMVEPVVRAVVEQDSFAFVAVARLEWVKFEARSMAAVIGEFRKWEDPAHVRMHLDHVPVIDEDGLRVDFLPVIQEAIDLGYGSVMVDGSRLPLDENITATRSAVELAHRTGIPCEAELGAVLGHEAGPVPPYDELFAQGKGFTDVGEAARFARESGCDWLSVAVGNIHGAISIALKDRPKPEARIKLERLEALAAATGIPLVLHGGSGIRREYVLEAVKLGIAKINVGTEIRQAYEVAVRELGDVPAAQEAVYRRTTWLIREFYGWTGTAGTIARA